MTEVTRDTDMANEPEPAQGDVLSAHPPSIPQHLLAWGTLALVVFCLGFFPLRSSTDEWWHLKTGKWIVEHGYRLPEKDIFSYTSADYHWENHEWLSQVFMYHIYKLGEALSFQGWKAVIFTKSILLVLCWLLLGRFLWQRCGSGRRGLMIALFVALLAAAVGRRMFWARPPVVSNILVVFFLYVMWMHRLGRLRTLHLLVLPLLMPLWANLHGGFLVGGMIVAAYFCGELVEGIGLRLFAKADPAALRAKWQHCLTYLILGVLCGLSSLINPYGYKLYLLSSRVMDEGQLVSMLSELQPPNYRYVWAFPFMTILIGLGFIWLIARSLRRQRPAWPPLPEMLLALFFFWQAAMHVRHLIFFGIIGAPLLAWMIREFWAKYQNRFDRFLRIAIPVAAIWLAAWLLFFPGEAWPVIGNISRFQPAFFAHSAVGRSTRLLLNDRYLNGLCEEPGAYPRRPVQFILDTMPPGRMYNRNNVCGYLIWKLSPEHYRLFTDNRFDIFGGDFLIDEMIIAEGVTKEEWAEAGQANRPGWMDLIEKYDINWLFLHRNENLHRKLISNRLSGWILVYMGREYAIWIRDTATNRQWTKKNSRTIQAYRAGMR